MSWFRTHRPQRLADLHLTQVRQQLLAFLQQGSFPQAMLFAGPKGTGKTSAARIIGAILNEPQNQALIEQHYFKHEKVTAGLHEAVTETDLRQGILQGKSYVVQEMDAASHRGIDDIRQLKERVFLPPQEGLMSVYILDEAHMLTTEAFNALLKLLEEPPSHVIFILATTELHKIPATIVSRCAVVAYTKASPVELVNAMERVAQLESVRTEPAALELIAEAADGSFRDAIKLLEFVAGGQTELNSTVVAEKLSHSVEKHVETLITAVLAKDAARVVELCQQLRQEGVNAEFFFKRLINSLHTSLLQSMGVASGTAPAKTPALLFLLQELNQLSTHSGQLPLLGLELKLLELIFRSLEKQQRQASGTAATASKGAPEPAPIEQLKVVKVESVTPDETLIVTTTPASTLTIQADLGGKTDVVPAKLELKSVVVSDNLAPVRPGDSTKLLSQWEDFVNLVRDKNSSVAALLRSATPISGDGDTAQVAVYYKFHQEQLQQPKFRKMIEDCVEPLIGGRVKLEFVLADPPAAAPSELGALAEAALV